MIGPKADKPSKAQSQAARRLVLQRCLGLCEGCGIRPATEMHHRLYRSRGGLDTAANLLHLCGGEAGLFGGNHSGCHGIAHTIIGEHLGWSVRSGNDPAIVPVFHKYDSTWTRNDVPMLAAAAMELLAALGQMREGISA